MIFASLSIGQWAVAGVVFVGAIFLVIFGDR